jgi:hypothetical protein
MVNRALLFCLALVYLAVLVSACAKPETFQAPTSSPAPPAPTIAVTETTSSQTDDRRSEMPAPSGSTYAGRPPSKLNGMCGGIMGLRCEAGLRCVMMGPAGKIADQAGTCQR